MNSYARKLIGSVAERAVKGRLKREGFSVQKFNYCGSPQCHECGFSTSHSDPTREEYPKQCKRGKKWLELMRHCDELKKTRTYLQGTGLDFYATKNGEEYLIEVKANKSRLSKSQKKLCNYAKKLGYHILYFRVTINVTGKINDVSETIS